VFAKSLEDDLGGDAEFGAGRADEGVGDVIGVTLVADEDVDVDAGPRLDTFPDIMAVAPTMRSSIERLTIPYMRRSKKKRPGREQMTCAAGA